MTPADPSNGERPFDLTPLSASDPAPSREPFWGYEDLFFVLAFSIPSLFASFLIVKVIPGTAAFGFPFQGLLTQLLWYGLVFGALAILFRMRYDQPFWRSLGWRFPFDGIARTILGGPLLTVAVALLGYALKAPEIPMPFQQMLQDKPTMVLFAIFVVVLGPVSEELAFRGFLMPLMMRTLGVPLGVASTGLLFGLMHAAEYHWSWRHVLLIAVAGIMFGWVRYKSGSTTASIFMHSTYNLTQFAAFVVQASNR
jgi:membrane protease YdiL (CAAX protease family)